MKIKEFYDEPTFTLSYVAYDEETKDAVIIDPVLDYEPQGSTIAEETADKILGFVDELKLNVHFIIETHAHADHLTSAQYLKGKLPQAITVIHENIKIVQSTFKDIFNFDDSFDVEGKTFDRLVKDNDVLEAGSLKIKALHTPGHTPACTSYLINEKALFTGDAIFMPDFGTGRCDFPAGSAEDLYNSITTKIFSLPDETEIYVGHDYQPNGRDLEFKTTVGDQKTSNVHIKEDISKEEFLKFRTARDKTLMAPKLLLASVQYLYWFLPVPIRFR